MCGIHASLSIERFSLPSHGLKQLLCNRGPDHLGEKNIKIENGAAPYFLSFTSTVLSLRGGHVAGQPFIDIKTGSILCWNGEAWKIGTEIVTGNDGQAIFDKLLKAIAVDSNAIESITAVLKVLNSISGPFAFVFFDRIHEQIFFGRDRLGRRSLLRCATTNGIEFSSTSDPAKGIWTEVEADAIYVLPVHGESTALESHDSPTCQSSPILPVQQYDWEPTKQQPVGVPPARLDCSNIAHRHR